jgi:hypothetical protein
LRDGGNSRKNSVQRIAAHYTKDLPLQDNTDFLRDEYLRGRYKYHDSEPGGKGFQFGNDRTSVWFTEDGIKIGRGDTALFARDFALITWEQAAERIGQLYDAGHYVNHDMLEEALQNEYHETAESLLNIYRDDFSGMRDIPEMLNYSGGWPDMVEHIEGLLKDHDQRAIILKQLREDVEAFDNYEGTLYRQYHDPHLTLHELAKLDIDPVGFPVTNIQNLNAMRFITNDEIDRYLTRGSHFTEGKMRIFSHFLNEHTSKERIDFLKNEYGHGGGTWGDGWSNAEPGKGITLQRPGCEDVNMKWPAVAKRIGELVQSGRYMPNVDLDRLHSYEMIILSRQVKRFFETLPEEERHQSPFGIALDFHYPKQAEREAMSAFFEDDAELDACLEKMAFFVANTLEDDRYFDTRDSVFRNLTAYCDDEYCLFPGVEQLPKATEPTAMSSVTETTPQPQPIGRRSRREPDPSQLNLFDASPFPELPSAFEQQAIIEQQDIAADAADVSAVEAEIVTEEPKVAEPAIEASTTTQAAEPPPQTEPSYKIGDVFQIDNKPWQIEKLDAGEWVHLKNLGEPSTFAVFDHTAVHKSNFDALLLADKIHAVAHEPPLEQEIQAEQTPSAENVGGSLISDESETPAPKLSPRLQAVADTAHKVPPYKSDDIILYQVGDFYEAYEEQADKLASLLGLSVVTDNSQPDVPLRLVGIPAHTLAVYTKQAQDNAEISFIVSNRLADGTRDISFITHPFHEMNEWGQFVYIESKYHGNRDYIEPFVIIQNSESPNFEEYERLTFTEADLKFKEVETAERELRAADGRSGGSHKTNGVIFYRTSPEDTELSTYEFRYDIGSYSAEKSGLYNHIDSFWEEAQEYIDHDIYTSHTQAEIDNMRDGLIPLLAQYRHLEQAPETEATAETPDTQETPQTQEQTAEPEPLTSPPPVFFVDWDKAQHDFDLSLYQDGDIVGYNKDGVETKLGRMGSLTYITTTGAFWGSNSVPSNIYEQIEAFHNGEVTEEQVRENYLSVLAAFADRKQTQAAPQRPPLLGEQIREELSNRGFAVSDELISDGVSEYNARGGKGNFEDVADFIEDEYLTEEPEQSVFYTKNNNIAYQVGDVFGQRSTKAVILDVDDDFIYYNFTENPQPEPSETPRARFEELLDNGTHRIISRVYEPALRAK